MDKTDIAQYLSQQDSTLREIIDLVDIPEFQTSEDVFHDLVWCIVEQQIPYRAKGYMMRKMKELLGESILSPSAIFNIDIESWIHKKLAKNKYETLIRLADYWNEKNLENIAWSELEDDEIRNELIAVKGIGHQMIDMILMYTLRRPNVFPANDYHLKIIMDKTYEFDDSQSLKKHMQKTAEQWKPYRSLAVMYLLAYKEFLKKK